ncbi:MAG: MmgE/PrpD family protein, partial [Alphaproteobacteria bacterium]
KASAQSINEAAVAARLARWTISLALGDVPDEVLHIARRCIVDTIGVAIAGSRLPVSNDIRTHISAQYGSGSCTLLGAGHGASALGAALANGVAAHALDFDDTSYAGVIHGSAIVLPAVLAGAEMANITGIGFLEAFVAGSEVVYALGLTLTESHYMRGWWATGTLGAIGASAGAAKALGLGEEETTAGIALAALQANGMLAMLGTDAKPIAAGRATRLGIESALLAAQGNSAPEHVFEDRRGFLALMNEGSADAAGLAGLGQTWRLMNPGIAVKRHPVCSAAQAAAELAHKLIDDNHLDRAQIESVQCDVPHLVRISLVYDNPETPAQAQFSMPFALGCILAYGMLGPTQISTETLDDESLRAAMSKVKMAETEDLNGEDYQPRYPECARVTISMQGGREFSGFLGASTGMPENPMSDEALSEKFRECCTFAGWPEESCEAILSCLWDIESVPDMGVLLKGRG